MSHRRLIFFVKCATAADTVCARSLLTAFFYYMFQMLKQLLWDKYILLLFLLFWDIVKYFHTFNCLFLCFAVFPMLVSLHSCKSRHDFILVFSQSGFHSEIFRSLWKIYQKRFAVSCQCLLPTFVFPEDFLTTLLSNHSLILPQWPLCWDCLE